MFLVIELQKTSETEMSNIVSSYVKRNQAESKYHQVLASAAVSDVLKHSAILITEEGAYIKGESFYHGETASEVE